MTSGLRATRRASTRRLTPSESSSVGELYRGSLFFFFRFEGLGLGNGFFSVHSRSSGSTLGSAEQRRDRLRARPRERGEEQ